MTNNSKNRRQGFKVVVQDMWSLNSSGRHDDFDCIWKLERKKNEEIKGRISKSLVLFHIKQQMIHYICTKLQNSMRNSSWEIIVTNFPMYRRLSLSQSPGDQTKYFEISVFRDSQPVTSFTFFVYMYVELQNACTCISQLCKYIPERNQYVEIICIFVCMGVN